MDLSLFITQEGMDRIQRRIGHLMNNDRPEVIKAVAIAREFGDLSENAEYKAAREKQRAIDAEIDYLRKRASRLKVVDTSVFPKDAIRFGSACETTDLDSGEKTIYKVVGADELNFFDDAGLQPVSVISPVGKALLGKKPGEVCVFRAPMGERRLRVDAVL